MLVFNSFRLDVTNASLSRGKQAILLTPKAFNVLRYLLEHAGQLVSKDDLWRAVWPGISVTDATLTNCVSEVRKALGDDSKAPRYIETLHRLGYRFIASVSSEPARIGGSRVIRQDSPPAPLHSPTPYFVGREAESAQLHEWLQGALHSERQIVIVTGEPGIGKTTLIEKFLRQVQIETGESLWIGRGQCIEHYGQGEAYLPLLDALGRLCREPQGGRLVELLEKHAPAWLVQMPALMGTAKWNALQGRVAGATRERMLRELADAVEVISQERALVLWLEDLHWSDYSTLEWLGFLARRPEPARLLVLGAYRPVEVIVREHRLRGLKQELQIHGQCRELPLSLLSEAAVTDYVSLRLASADSSSSDYRKGGASQEMLHRLATSIYRRTDGNPLFMVNMVDHLVEQTAGVSALVATPETFELDRVDTPANLVEMIEHNLEGLNPDEQAMLEAASVTGIEFTAAAVAAALERPVNDTEAYCTQLARRQQFIEYRGMGELPDGTLTASFGFLHALYRDVLHQRVPPGRRAELHRLIAERAEQAYGANAGDAAVELAYHYRLSGNRTKTVRYLELAAERAEARRAYHEAERHYRDAIELLGVLPESPERDLRELELMQHLVSITDRNARA
jgi:predicted ATPase/DNA-binding winged helix-turn-helix (wHTH) protein